MATTEPPMTWRAKLANLLTCLWDWYCRSLPNYQFYLAQEENDVRDH